MALEMNVRIKKIKEKLSSNTAGSISDFSSEVESSLNGIVNSLSSLKSKRGWDDSVFDKVSGALDSTEVILKSKIKAVNSLSKINDLVNDLYTCCKEYVENFEKYVADGYNDINKSEEDDDYEEWSSNKEKIELLIEQKESDALKLEKKVKSAFDSIVSMLESNSDDVISSNFTLPVPSPRKVTPGGAPAVISESSVEISAAEPVFDLSSDIGLISDNSLSASSVIAASGSIEGISSTTSSTSHKTSKNLKVDYELEELTGSEFLNYCRYNKIDPNLAIIKKAVVKINGTDFNVFHVYNKTLSDSNHMNFESYVMDCIDEISKIDKDLLCNMNSTDLIFEEDYNVFTDRAMAVGAQAMYVPDINSVIAWYSAYANSDFGTGVLVHEMGHCFDANLGTRVLKTNDFHKMYTHSVDKRNWINLIKEEADSFRNSNIEGLCPAYNKEVYLNDGYTEYLAEVFYSYFYSDDTRAKLKLSAPKTYAELEKIIDKMKKV